jgi:hypothetical protein
MAVGGLVPDNPFERFAAALTFLIFPSGDGA